MLNGNGNIQRGNNYTPPLARSIAPESTPRMPRSSHPSSLVEVAKTAAEDLLDLLASQFKLARVELASDIKKAVGPFALVAVFAPIVLVGYGFALAAVASWLASWWGWTTALAMVGGAQVLVGGLGMGWAFSRLKGRHILERASSDVAETVRDTIAAIAHTTRSADVHPRSTND